MNARLCLVGAALLGGCNAYAPFLLTGHQQESFTSQADILFVIDNSPTMSTKSEALARNFTTFIDAFASDDARPSNPDLANDVERFLDSVRDRAGNINFQLGVTTTDVNRDVGALLGQPRVLRKTDRNVSAQFNERVLCDAACIDRIPGDVDASCPGGDPRFRNCAGLSGAVEEGLEAVFLTMCRAVDDPPEACWDRWWAFEQDLDYRLSSEPMDEPGWNELDYLREGRDAGSASNWLRPNSTVIPVIISDEGDESRRIPTRDGQVWPYDDLFREFPNRMSWAVIGPHLSNCNTEGSPDWAIDRYRRMVADTNGVYVEIRESDGPNACRDVDFATALGRIGELLRSLMDTFPLRGLPAPDSITVQVGQRVIPRAEEIYDESLDLVFFEDGWSYNPIDNTVILHGSAIPDVNELVRVWYDPADGIPRPLPF